MDYIVENKADIMDDVSFVDAPGTLINDMLVAFIRSEKEDGDVGGSDENKFASMRVSELRKKAHENGLNVDGSRETLITAIKAVQELKAEVGSSEDTEESDEEPEDL